MVSAKHSATGHPIGVLGPQVGYYVPQILMEQDIHGGGLDARGATFPGVNVIVQLGHGTDYAWSATTANTDNVDTFAEVLCQDDFHYLYKGECLRDGEARAHQLLVAERGRRHACGVGDADRLPDRARHRLRARDGDGQEGRLRHRAHDLLPRGRLGARASTASTSRAASRTRSRSARRSPRSTSASTGPTSTRSTPPTSSRAGTRSAPAGPRPTSRSSGPASTTGRASTRCATPWPCSPTSSARTSSTSPTRCRGTASRRAAGRPPTTSTTGARCSASR